MNEILLWQRQTKLTPNGRAACRRCLPLAASRLFPAGAGSRPSVSALARKRFGALRSGGFNPQKLNSSNNVK